MSEEFLSCKCSVFKYVCCCPPKSGIQILQPWCQIIEDKCGCESKVNNPFYWSNTKKSYFTYKVCVDCICNNEPKPVSHIAIPVCKKIDICDMEVHMKIEEGCSFCKLDKCRDFYFDDEFGGIAAPKGFKWLIIKNKGLYGNGICALYRLTIDGRFETAAQGILVESGDNYLSFNCGIADGCYKVPGCKSCSRLHVTKECSTVNENIQFTIKIKNEGDAPVKINLLDEISIPEHVTVQFKDFNGCKAAFQGSGDPVQLNQNVVNAKINIICNGININPGQTIIKAIKIKVMEIRGCSSSEYITNIIPKDGITSCGEANPESNLPVCKAAKVEILVNCSKPFNMV